MAELSKNFNELSDGKPSFAERDEQLLKELDHNYSMREDGAESIGRIGLSYQKRSEFSQDPKKKKHLADLLHRLLEHQRWLQNRMEELGQEIAIEIISVLA